MVSSSTWPRGGVGHVALLRHPGGRPLEAASPTLIDDAASSENPMSRRGARRPGARPQRWKPPTSGWACVTSPISASLFWPPRWTTTPSLRRSALGRGADIRRPGRSGGAGQPAQSSCSPRPTTTLDGFRGTSSPLFAAAFDEGDRTQAWPSSARSRQTAGPEGRQRPTRSKADERDYQPGPSRRTSLTKRFDCRPSRSTSSFGTSRPSSSPLSGGDGSSQLSCGIGIDDHRHPVNVASVCLAW